MQNRAAKILTNSAFDAPSSPIIMNLGWVSLSKKLTAAHET